MALHSLLICLALVICSRVEATTIVHKCVSRQGAVSYQNAPCAAESRQEWTRTVIEPAVSPAAATPTSRRRGGRDNGAAGAAPPADDSEPLSASRTEQTSRVDARLRAPRSSKPGIGRKPSSRRRSVASGALISLTPNSNSTACAKARQRREDTLERLAFKRRYADLQKLDAAVQKACQ